MATRKKKKPPKKERKLIKVLMIREHPKIGIRGEEVKVKRGYFRNYLLPSLYAVYLTPENKAVVGEVDQTKVEERKKLAVLNKSMKRIAKVVVKLKMHMANGMLKIPLTPPIIAKSLFKQHQIEIKEDQIRFRGKPIMTPGLHEIDLLFEGNHFPLKVQLEEL
jgi:large subunit ribosomal protein L9